MSAIVTSNGRTMLAKSFMKNGKVHFGLGHDSKCSDQPPKPVATSTIVSLVGMKRAEKLAYVIPDVNGKISYRGKTYTEIPEADIFTKQCKHVLITSEIADGDFDYGTKYNQISINTDVVTIPGKENSFTLKPSEISKPGISFVIDFRRTVIVDTDTASALTVVLEF